MALIVAASAAFLWFAQCRKPFSAPASSTDAFARTYLDVAAGRPIQVQRQCASCHESADGFAPEAWEFLSARWKLSASAWATAIQLEARCGSCHVTPDPRTLPWKSWNEALYRMEQVMQQKDVPQLTAEERRDIIHYYYAFSPEQMPPLAPDPDPKFSPLQFAASALGRPITNVTERPFIGQAQVTDLDQDGRPDVLVCDSDGSSLNWVREKSNASHGEDRPAWQEEVLAEVPCPARAEVFTNRVTGQLDIVVACQQRMAPTDDPIGSVVLLRNETLKGQIAELRYKPVTIISNISRVAAVEPGDFNRDGEIDFVVAAFGHITTGEILLLEAKENAFSARTIVKRTGAIRACPVDLNGDSFLDFIALFGQEHEQISAFLNNENSTFREVILFKAATPSFGCSSLELVDLDQDGDTDVLFTNGDNMDLDTRLPRPYHGVQWLENRGELQFVCHDIFRLYGAYCAIPTDLNQDGRLDIVVASLFNDWQDPSRASLVWLENTGGQQFTPHAIAREPIQLISAAAADLNKDGWPDLIASGMHIFPPYDRAGRVTLWTRIPFAHP